MLDPVVRADLHGLGKGLADVVAAHIVAAGLLLDDEPDRALEHAKYARARAPRVASVREALGVALYSRGDYADAVRELRAARRISGDPSTLPMIADCERALGRPERALQIAREPDVDRLGNDDSVELRIVLAGARRDLGQIEAALVTLADGGLDSPESGDSRVRLWYAYADTLIAADRPAEAKAWFERVAAADVDGETDATERLATL